MIKFGLAGYPIADSLSPRLFDAAYHGNWPYELLESPDFEVVADRFRGEPFRAINVTAPFKSATLQLCDSLSEEVRECGAANILVKESGIKAYNSDFLALKEMLRGAESVLVIGGSPFRSPRTRGGTFIKASRRIGRATRCGCGGMYASTLCSGPGTYKMPQTHRG